MFKMENKMDRNYLAKMTVEDFVKKFADEDTKNMFLDEMEENFKKKSIYFDKNVSPEEKISWKNSLFEMSKILNQGVLNYDSQAKNSFHKNCWVILEFKFFQDWTRADFLLCGKRKDENGQIIVVELKQWDKDYVSAVEDADEIGCENIVKLHLNNKPNELTYAQHPSYQSLVYKSYLQNNYSYVIKEHVNVHSCSYLHNYFDTDKDRRLIGKYPSLIEKSRFFYKKDIKGTMKFTNYIYDLMKNCECVESNKLVNGLLNSSINSIEISKIFDKDHQFYLVDDQYIEYYEILTWIKWKQDNLMNNEKAAVIVSGGPGTGKSSVALQLFKTLKSNNLRCEFITPNDFFKNCLQCLIDDPEINKNIILPSDCPECVDVIVCDEANRLKNSKDFPNQISKLIDKGKVVLFFQDDDQLLIPEDDGSKNKIIECCHFKNIETKEIYLKRQYRCKGGNEYINWLDKVLQLKDNVTYQSINWRISDYDFRIFTKPETMIEELCKRVNEDQNNDARILAGHSWHYLDQITIDNFKANWNSINDRTWALKHRLDQAGSVQAVQGMNFDYVGVIIGKDLQFDDRVFGSANDYLYEKGKRGLDTGTFDGQDAIDTYIKRVYKVLLTRGTKGCYLYCCDSNLGKWFEENLLPYLQEIAR